jgi:hypothetical protein
MLGLLITLIVFTVLNFVVLCAVTSHLTDIYQALVRLAPGPVRVVAAEKPSDAAQAAKERVAAQHQQTRVSGIQFTSRSEDE